MEILFNPLDIPIFLFHKSAHSEVNTVFDFESSCRSVYKESYSIFRWLIYLCTTFFIQKRFTLYLEQMRITVIKKREKRRY